MSSVSKLLVSIGIFGCSAIIFLLLQACFEKEKEPCLSSEDREETRDDDVSSKTDASLGTLRGTGLLNLDIGTESNRTLSIPIHQIPRSAIQRADYSMFHSNLVLAIRPRCTPGNENDSRFQPFYIAVQSRESLETWYVLLQTLATPELYGSQQSSTTHDEFSLDVDLPRSGREARPMIRIL